MKEKSFLLQEEIDKLVYVLNKTKTCGQEELTQDLVDELVAVLLETRTRKCTPTKLLDNPEVYNFFSLKLTKGKRTA